MLYGQKAERVLNNQHVIIAHNKRFVAPAEMVRLRQRDVLMLQLGEPFRLQRAANLEVYPCGYRGLRRIVRYHRLAQRHVRGRLDVTVPSVTYRTGKPLRVRHEGLYRPLLFGC